MRALSPLAYIFSGFVIGAMLFIGASVVLAWTGPTSAPPNSNVSAPINVGTTDQIKNAGLGISSLAVFGNAILAGVSSYLNFGSTAGSEGYGIRDNDGVMEYKDSDGDWIALNSLGSGGGSGNNFVISSDTQNVNLYVLAGSPATAGSYTFTINPSVTVGSASTASAAVSTGVWPAGSSVTLINNGNIYGKGGNGGAGGNGPTCSFWGGGCWGTVPGASGGAGGPAISLGYNITIDNTNGKIYGGGGGGGGGTGLPPMSGSSSAGGSGGGGGQGVVTSSGGAGGTGSFPGGTGDSGSAAAPGAGGTYSQFGGNTTYYAGNGGAWATVGGADSYSGTPGGAGGGAISLNGNSITWLGGNDATHVKGAVQ